MIHIVTGGSGSGKSEYAERLTMNLPSGRLIYLATMMVWNEEGRERVRRHRDMRAGKGFTTVERYTDLSSFKLAPAVTPFSGGEISSSGGGLLVLLECMSNLAANEFYRDERLAFHNIMEGLSHLWLQCRDLVIVTNEVFSDGTGYDDETMRYIRLLGTVNRRLGQIANTVTEVVYGIPVTIKG